MARWPHLITALVVAATLTACANSGMTLTTPDVKYTPTAAPAVAATVLPESVVGDEVRTSGCIEPDRLANCEIKPGECYPWSWAANTDPNQVAGSEIEIPKDSGPRKYATGTTILNSKKVPVAYIVGAGDILDFISARLCMQGAYLNTINQVRRDGPLYAGDTLNLDAHTIVSVGDENGVVYKNEAPDPIPPQH
ncbi:hypothetical protein [Glaciihabitans sp. dw_435]|uniref:hypothetical protein n=1 Tax=Glaciihabitans sp. dw_435 TaxID=2720081 RepID=UPI001BD615E2|nr:hypothetical protein [Glaciihabitans sp. dw_435]